MNARAEALHARLRRSPQGAAGPRLSPWARPPPSPQASYPGKPSPPPCTSRAP
jgi:hypothetical protein